ncbi:MAG: class IV adenylate cyclase [Bacteroidia bacterium]|nr:class IV adenylate cyclase [Bacteroidia bacterium]
MKEIEVKVLEIDRQEVEARLNALGAQKEFEAEFFAIVFDDATGGIKAAGNLLRLRREGESVTLTYKVNLGSATSKSMEEHEVTVSDFEEMRRILGAMGYREVLSHRKIRAQWRLPLGHAVIDRYLDKLACIPEFLELEASSETDLNVMLEQLGFRPEQALPWNTQNLMQFYGA